MLNRFPLWKNLLVVLIAVFGLVYAAPNLYAPDSAVQISGQSGATVIDDRALAIATKALDEAGIDYFGGEADGKSALLRLASAEHQLAAKEVIQRALGDNFVVALNLAPTTPEWLRSIGAEPMKLGLDLAGGVHFLLEVDTAAAVAKRLESDVSEIKSNLRKAKIRYLAVDQGDDNVVTAVFRSAEDRDNASSAIRSDFPSLEREAVDEGERFILRMHLSEQATREMEDYAVSQNLTTLRNRVNELGVSEPIVQRQGRNRVVVELPGVQDTAEAKRIIGKTANLEFRLEARPSELVTRKEAFSFRSEMDQRRFGDAYLEKQLIISGDHVANAQSGFDSQTGQPQVNITLDSLGGTKMHRATRNNVGRRMGVLFIEYKTVTDYVVDEKTGETRTVQTQAVERRIISLATIQSALGVQFRITGLDNTAEASELALLLRAGALAAPMYFVEERTIGPSLGAENIQLGIKSVQIGLGLVLIFMLFYYRVFGLAANIALAMNLVLLVACMSILGATLTLPGIAGIVLTVGMAVDANVLIFSRIREEIAEGASCQAAIYSGFERAFTTILDANITTLIVAVILYAIGSGPVQGFAVTLSIGILTSMFTAIVGTRAIINLLYGGRRNLEKLWI